MPLFNARARADKRFWHWFQEHEDQLFTSSPPSPLWVEELSTELHRVDRDLVWEVSAIRDGRREFVISADGVIAAFAAVESLADAAPPLRRWTITRFRPREPEYHLHSLEIGDLTVSAREVECVLLRSDGKLGIQMFFRGCPAPDAPEFRRAAFLLLDSALGEYDMECKVGLVGVHPFEAVSGYGERFPFALLREQFDRTFESEFTQGG